MENPGHVPFTYASIWTDFAATWKFRSAKIYQMTIVLESAWVVCIVTL